MIFLVFYLMYLFIYLFIYFLFIMKHIVTGREVLKILVIGA